VSLLQDEARVALDPELRVLRVELRDDRDVRRVRALPGPLRLRSEGRMTDVIPRIKKTIVLDRDPGVLAQVFVKACVDMDLRRVEGGYRPTVVQGAVMIGYLDGAKLDPSGRIVLDLDLAAEPSLPILASVQVTIEPPRILCVELGAGGAKTVLSVPWCGV